MNMMDRLLDYLESTTPDERLGRQSPGNGHHHRRTEEIMTLCGNEYVATWPGSPRPGVLHTCDRPAGHPTGGYFVHGADVDAGLADWSGDDPDRLEWTDDGGDCRTTGGGRESEPEWDSEDSNRYQDRLEREVHND